MAKGQTMTTRITAVLIGSLLLAPPTLAAQPENDEPEPPPETCPHACCFDPYPSGVGWCNIFDWLEFIGQFVAGEPCAIDMDTSTGIGVGDIFDFLVFQQEFVTIPHGGYGC